MSVGTTDCRHRKVSTENSILILDIQVGCRGGMMEVMHTHCAGLDVHKRTVVASILISDGGKPHKATQTFGTTTAELLKLSDWLNEHQVTHVAMESTGEYWKPVYNILEDNFELLLVNAQHIKAVPGRKTDVKDSEWIAELLRFGLLKASFVPPKGQRELRELTRARSTFVRERANLVNRVQKVLESANIKLASVLTDVEGVSGRSMLKAIIAGTASAEEMAQLAQGRLKAKREALELALEGRVRPHHRFILQELLNQIESLDATLTKFDDQIEEYCRPFEAAVTRLDTIPGVARDTAEVIVAEIGIDMSRFPTADHLASWAGLAPGNNRSADKQLSSRTTQGNQALVTVLTQAAWAASHTKNTYLSAQYHRLATRRGRKRAIVAVAHSILIIAYHLIKNQETYRELGGDYFDKRNPQTVAKRLVRRLESLGYSVTLEQPLPTAA
jgi:transposase